MCSSPLLGIARQWLREKFGILSLMRRSHIRILTYRTWAIQICIPAFIMSSKYFTITSLYWVDWKIFEGIKFPWTHVYQNQENWSVKNCITTSCVFMLLLTHAETQTGQYINKTRVQIQIPVCLVPFPCGQCVLGLRYVVRTSFPASRIHWPRRPGKAPYRD